MIQLLSANSVTAIGLAFGIKIAAAATGDASVWMALLVGFAAWLTFSATTLLQHNAFELKPAKLTAINTGYQLALFLAMPLLIGLCYRLPRPKVGSSRQNERRFGRIA